jgi:hypothetical protein
MSDFSLTLVLYFKTSKIFNGMAKVQIKSEKITPFGGVFHVREQFSRFVGPVIVLFPILLQSLRLCLSNLSDSTVLLF